MAGPWDKYGSSAQPTPWQKYGIQHAAGGKTDAEPEPISAAGTAMDMLKSGAAHVGKGVIGLTGALGDVQQMTGDAAGGVAGYFGASPEMQEMARSGGRYMAFPGMMGQAPTSAAIKAPIDAATNHVLDYEPQTQAGRYAGTVGEFIPGAVAGPGGLVRKGAMAIASGLASEGAGQLAEGTAAEPYARIGGALAGGATVAGRSGAPVKQMVKNAPSQPKVRAQANALYDRLDQGGVAYDANAYSQMLVDLDVKLKTYRPTKAPMTADTTKYLESYNGKSPSFRDLEDMRQEATGILRERTATDTDKAAAHIVIDALSDFGDNAPLITNGSIPANEVAPLVKQARDLGRRNIIAKQIGEMERKAGHYVSGDESGLRNQFSVYMKSGRGKSLSPMEKKAFGKVERREGAANLLSSTGSRLIGQMLAASAGIATGGLAGAATYAGGLGVHLGARKLSEALTKSSVRKAMATALAGRTAQETARRKSSTLRDQIAARLLLTGASGIASANGH